MDTNTLYMEHYVDLHNYISDNIYELDENCIFENGIGDLLKKTVEGGKNAVKWLCTTIQKLWHFITKWFTSTQRRDKQEKLRGLINNNKNEIAKEDIKYIGQSIVQIYTKPKNEKYHLLDLKAEDFAVIVEEILKYCQDKDSFLEFYLNEDDFEKLHKIIKILDKLSDRLIHRFEEETDVKDFINRKFLYIRLIDDYLDSKNYKGFQKFLLDLSTDVFNTVFIKGLNSFVTFLIKMTKIKSSEIDDDVIKDIKIEIVKPDHEITDKKNIIKYIDLLKNIKTIQKFFIHYILMLDLLIESINKVCNITDAEIVSKKKEG